MFLLRLIIISLPCKEEPIYELGIGTDVEVYLNPIAFFYSDNIHNFTIKPKYYGYPQ